MNLIEQIKKWFNKKDIKDNNISHIESINLAIIDTTGLKIDRSLTKEENESRKKFLEELSLGNFSTFINYGNEISKEINYYMEICRKRIDQGINSNKELARNISTKNIIAEKIKIIFNKAEIENIIDELNGLKRTCELRVIALEEFGNGEIKRRKKKIHFLDNKTTDESKINTINNTISRISAIIKIIDTLICSLNIEKNNYLNENSSLDIFINASDSNSTKEIANNVLIETFYELKSNLASIASFTNISSLNFLGTPINEINIESGSLSIKSKINIIALLKRYLDLYIEQNKKHLLANGGLLERANISLNSLIDEIESDYLDIDLWAKKAFGEVAITNKEENSKVINTVYIKYYKRLNNIQRFLSIFEEEIPESFKDRFYRTKFNFYALYIETFKNDAFYDDNPIKINNEEERKYFLKFIEEIIDRIHRRSNDGELLKFMNKHLSLKNRDSILDKYYKFATLLRIDKYGRDGLFTLMLYTANFKNKYNHICCLDQIEPKYLQYLNLQFLQVKSNSMAQDILKLWKPSNNHFSRFWGDMDENWDLARTINDGLYPRSDHANIQNTMDPDYRKFLIEKMQDYNKFARKNNIKTKYKYINFFGNQICKVQYIAMYAYMMERFSNGLFPREQIFKKLIQADNDKNLYNFNYITEKILINYLKENLNKVDYKHFINKFKSQLHGSENLIGILKSIDREKILIFLSIVL